MIKNPFNTFYYPSMKMNPNMTTVLTRRNRKTNKKSMEMSNLDATNQESYNNKQNSRSLFRFIYDLVVSVWLFILSIKSYIPILKPLDEQDSDSELSVNSVKSGSIIVDYSSSEDSDYDPEQDSNEETDSDERYSSEDSDYDPEEDYSSSEDSDYDPEQDSNEETDSDERYSSEDSDYDPEEDSKPETDSVERYSSEDSDYDPELDCYQETDNDELDVSEDTTVLPVECVRKCRGVTSRKTNGGLPSRCKITNEMAYDETRASYTQEAAARMISEGSNYCSYHASQEDSQEDLVAYRPSVHPVIYGIKTSYRATMSSLEKQTDIQEAYENHSIPLDSDEAWKFIMDKKDIQKEYGVDKLFDL